MATDYFELSRLLANRRAGMNNPGAASLGYLLGGGGKAREQQIYNQAALQGAHMQDALAQARYRQQQGIEFDRQQAARQRISDRYRSQNKPELADMFDAFNNPDQVATAEKTLQAADFARQAWAARNGSLNDLNRDLMVIHGQPVQTARNEGGVILNPYGAVDQQTVTTEIGKALAGEHNAAAAQHYAGAALDKARTDAVTGKGNSSKPQGLTTELTKAIFSKPVLDQDGKQMTDSQGRPVTQIDTGKLANFMQFADRPGVPANQNAAIPAYVNAVSPDNPPPGAMDLGDAFAAKQANDAKVNSILATAPDPQRARELFNQSTTAQPAAKIATPQTQADFDALPSGATYVNPADGKTYRKK